MGGGLKPNSNVPIVDVPKWLWRGVSGLIGTMSLNTGFFKASLTDISFYTKQKLINKSFKSIEAKSKMKALLK